MLTTATAIALVCFVSFAVMIGISMIFKIWKADTEKIKEYQRLKDLVLRANNGDEAARRVCDENGLINKGMVLCEDGINVRSTYSLPYKWL